MIKTFKNKDTRSFAEGEVVKQFEAFARSAARRLAALDAADTLDALRQVRGNRLEALKDDRKGQHSIRINEQWRICFVWDEQEGAAYEVEITDYH